MIYKAAASSLAKQAHSACSHLRGTMIAKRLRSLLVCLLFPAAVLAQESYPSRPITMIVPFPPGGQADISARPLADALSRLLKQPVVVVNRPGASGAIGNRFVAAAPPDGYTILVSLVSIVTIPAVDEMFGRKSPYSMGDFAPLALISAEPPVLVARADTPWKSAKELVAFAKAHPDDLVYSHSGLYGPSHLPMEMFLKAAGAKMRGLPAVGGAPAMMLVLGGSAQMWPSPPAMAGPQVAAAKLRPLATFGAQRDPGFPDVPTLKELGYDVEFYVWSGAFAPAGTPQPVLAILRDAIRKALASTEFKAAMAGAKSPISYLDAPQFGQYLATESTRLRKAVEQIGKIE
jgi:tripartite-type tricarboxylate transporter receptor subunit TctC